MRQFICSKKRWSVAFGNSNRICPKEEHQNKDIRQAAYVHLSYALTPNTD